MKKIFFLAVAALVTLAAAGKSTETIPTRMDSVTSAVSGTDQAPVNSPSAFRPRHLDPTVVAVGKELPRGDVVSHDSKAEAVRGTFGPSRYLQPLGDWTRTETPEAVSFKTRFRIPFGWIDRIQLLHVARATGSYDVIVNGVQVAYSQTGSTPGEFDITAAQKDGANELEIVIYRDPVARQLENSRPAPATPALQGEVYILSQPRVRVRDVAVSTRMNGPDGLLELGIILKSHRLNPHEYTVFWELLNPAGEIVAEGNRATRLDERREDTVRFFANIPRVAPWSHEDPRLYTLFIKTQNEGRFREYLSFRVGFRSYSLLDDGGLALNGVPLRVAMREFSVSGSGSASGSGSGDLAAMRAEVLRLRASGVGGLVLRGAPPSGEFFALCDSLGIYVACQADIDTRESGPSRAVGGNPSNDPAWREAYLDRVMAMYHTSKNHPSVAMFSLASSSANGYNLYESYLALKALEQHRPVIYTDGGGEWNSDFAGSGSGFGSASGTGPESDPFILEAIDIPAGRFRVANLREITPLAGEAMWRVLVGRRVVASGVVPVTALPGEQTELSVPITGTKPGRPYAVAIEIAVESPSGDYLPDGGPDLKVFRRLDQPLAPGARSVVVSGRWEAVAPKEPKK